MNKPLRCTAIRRVRVFYIPLFPSVTVRDPEWQTRQCHNTTTNSNLKCDACNNGWSTRDNHFVSDIPKYRKASDELAESTKKRERRKAK